MIYIISQFACKCLIVRLFCTSLELHTPNPLIHKYPNPKACNLTMIHTGTDTFTLLQSLFSSVPFTTISGICKHKPLIILSLNIFSFATISFYFVHNAPQHIPLHNCRWIWRSNAKARSWPPPCICWCTLTSLVYKAHQCPLSHRFYAETDIKSMQYSSTLIGIFAKCLHRNCQIKPPIPTLALFSQHTTYLLTMGFILPVSLLNITDQIVVGFIKDIISLSFTALAYQFPHNPPPKPWVCGYWQVSNTDRCSATVVIIWLPFMRLALHNTFQC